MSEQAQKISIDKQFNASKEQLYKAWTSEEDLKQWWKPMNKQLVSVQNDIKEGGAVTYTFENELKVSGTYKEVTQGDKLVYSWNWELPDDSHHKGEYLLTVVFKGNGDQSELEVVQENFKSEHSVKPHQEGWEQALQDLKQYLEQKQ